MQEHSGGLEALLFLPVVVLAFLMLAGAAANRGDALAARFVAGFEAASAATKLAALLMLVSASVHLGLVPAHWIDQPATAALFVLDAVILSGLSLLLLGGRRWVGLAAIAVLLVGVASYGGYLFAGLDSPDPIGLITKLVELGAVGLLAASASTRSFIKGVSYR